MRTLWRRLLITAAIYCALWCITAISGTREACQHLGRNFHVDASYASIPCYQFPESAPDHAFDCCAVSYAPFLVVTQWAYYDEGFSNGSSAVCLWFGRAWILLPWPWGHSWIT